MSYICKNLNDISPYDEKNNNSLLMWLMDSGNEYLVAKYKSKYCLLNPSSFIVLYDLEFFLDFVSQIINYYISTIHHSLDLAVDQEKNKSIGSVENKCRIGSNL